MGNNSRIQNRKESARKYNSDAKMATGGYSVTDIGIREKEDMKKNKEKTNPQEEKQE